MSSSPSSPPSDALIARYGVPASRVIGASPLLGRPGLLKSSSAGSIGLHLSGSPSSSDHSRTPDGSPSFGRGFGRPATGGGSSRAPGAMSLAELKRIAHAGHEDGATAAESQPSPSCSKAFEQLPKQRRKRRPQESILPTLAARGGSSEVGSARAIMFPDLDGDSMWRSGFIDLDDDEDSTSEFCPDDLAAGQSGDKKQGLGRRRKPKANPFLDYDALEKRLQCERRWLQEDSDYMSLRTRGLQHNTVQERVGRKTLTLDPEASPGSPQRGGGQKSRGHQQQQQQQQQLSQTFSFSDLRRQRSPKHGELAALKGMQKELKESIGKTEKLLVAPPQAAGGGR